MVGRGLVLDQEGAAKERVPEGSYQVGDLCSLFTGFAEKLNVTADIQAVRIVDIEEKTQYRLVFTNLDIKTDLEVLGDCENTKIKDDVGDDLLNAKTIQIPFTGVFELGKTSEDLDTFIFQLDVKSSVTVRFEADYLPWIFLYRFNGGRQTSDIQNSMTYLDLPPGIYYLQFQVWDGGNNGGRYTLTVEFSN